MGRFLKATETMTLRRKRPTIYLWREYVGREYTKEMRLLVKNQEGNEPKNRWCRIRKRQSCHL
jgi:hypothetical protein